MSKPYLLYTILGITALHRNAMSPSEKAQHLAMIYRQKTFSSYNSALQNVTTDNYESLLLTSVYLQPLVPVPDLPATDEAVLEWLSTYLAMTQGLRLLVSLKWSRGLEKLSIFPVFRRELKTLPPCPLIIPMQEDPRMYAQVNEDGGSPYRPNPPIMYREPVSAGYDMSNLPFQPQTLMGVGATPHRPPAWESSPTWLLPAPAFLPPPLMALLVSLIKEPESGPLDLYGPTILPALHALSPIFLSLYYYHLTPDVFVRIVVFPTFLTAGFIRLVRHQEPRAIVIMAWWIAFVTLIPSVWWIKNSVQQILQATSNVMMRNTQSNQKLLMDAMDGAFKVARLAQTRGKEVAAKSIFEGWEGVNWDREVGYEAKEL